MNSEKRFGLGRPGWRAVLPCLVAAMMGPAFGQFTPLGCLAMPDPVPRLRASEIAARVGDFAILCSGGTPTPAGEAVPTRDILLYFNADQTGRRTGDLTETLLLIDDPEPPAQVPCMTDVSLCGWTGGSKGANVFQGRVLAPNAIAFYGVPLDPPGDFAQRVFRIVNARVNVTTLAPPGSLDQKAVTVNISLSGITVKGGTGLLTGVTQPAMRAQIRSSNGDALVSSPTGIEFPNCTSVTRQRFANLRFSELFATAFQGPNWTYDAVTGAPGAPASQAAPRTVYHTESGFYNPEFPSTHGLNKAGLADFGTRVQATFTGLPAGVTIYVSTLAVTYDHGAPAANANSVEQARLTASATGAFAAVPATETLDGLPAAALTVSQGRATAVWEVLNGAPAAMGNLDFPVWISFPGNVAGLGTANVTLRLAPVSDETSASETAPLPRFAEDSATLPLLTILDMCPSTQYLVTTSPAFQPVTVDGLTYTSPKPFPWQPGSTHAISVAGAIPAGPGVRQSFLGWSDGGALTHTITVPVTPTTYTAAFQQQFLLDVKVTPAGGGTVTRTPASADGYYDPGKMVTLVAKTNPLYSFSGYTTEGSKPLESTTLTMWQAYSVAAEFVKAGPVSSTIGVSPASGSGPEANFLATYEGSGGAQSLSWVQLLIAAAPDGGGQPFCFVHYDVQGGGFWLYSDIDGFFQGPVAPGDQGAALQGSSCALDPSLSYPSVNGARLTVHASVLFKTPGARNVYLRTMDASGADTGWVQQGSWTQEAMPPPTMLVSPTSGLGAEPLFRLSFYNPYHASVYFAPVGWQQLLVAADPSGGGEPFCFVHYDRAGDELWMYSSDVGFFLGPVKPWTSSTVLDSSACSVGTALSGPVLAGRKLQGLELQLSLKSVMRGLKKVYMRALDPLQLDSGWQFVGTHQVP
ncbi:InlB B-repeat-containing protein [Paludibaculum fermentans]|uniref:InlB B-repeat-containing protein n=1 Tax=Paludibaculum fermentans TaxID=1473598 RepID=UPI003EB766AA